jgi:hypothetical protein
MALLKIQTNVDSHPEIEITGMDFEKSLVNFRWIGGTYAGDCSETFVLSIAEHGEMTLTQIIEALSQQMIALLAGADDE